MSVRPVLSLFLWTAVIAAAQSTSPFLPEQGWNDELRRQFWYVDQGSRLIPLAWFDRLERPGNAPAKFRDHLERFGFVPDDFGIAGSLNQAKLPIGFSVSTAGDVGLTCAACHTNLITQGTRRFLVEGAPAMFNFELFLSELVDAMDQTLTDPARSQRFFAGLPPETPARFRTRFEELKLRRTINTPDTPAGYGRVDAFGNIFNQVLVEHLGNPPSYSRKPNAPASYPALWDVAQHKYVQWNYSAPNLGVGRDAIGSQVRNIGEVLGVFGTLKVTSHRVFFIKKWQYDSSIQPAQLENLKAIEAWLEILRSPRWPFAPPSVQATSEGRRLYNENCVSCHALLDNPAQATAPFPAKAIAQTDVQTDDLLARNAVEFTGPSGVLRGALVKVKPCTPLAKIHGTQPVADLTGHLSASLVPNQMNLFEVARASHKACADTREIPSGLVYKARPLNGIWATAPYLHNGSVPNLWELLQPAEQRLAKFCVGDGQYDVEHAGYNTYQDQVSSCPPRTSLVDTTQAGSRNIGHPYGTQLSNAQKRALLEFLKTL